MAEEIVVTAQRRAQNAVELPATIDAISSEQLENISAVHPAEALNTSAGVNIHRGSGQEHLTAMRSPVLTGGAGAGSFLYLQDGVALRAAGFANVNGLFESGIELSSGTEIFKGPGSVLYGSNAQHGLINVLSRAPETEFGGDYSLLLSDAFIRAKTSLTGERIRLSLSAAHDRGFRADSGFDQQKMALRKDFQLGIWDSEFLLTAQNLNQETAGFIQGPRAYDNDALRETNPNPEAYRDGKSALAQLKMTRDWGDGTLALTPYARSIKLEFLRHFVPGQAREENGHNSIGLLTTFYGKDYVAGFDVDLTRGELVEFQDGPGVFSFISGAHYDYEVDALMLAAYGQKELSLSDNVTAQIGARAEYTRYDYDNRIDNGNFGRFKRIPDRQDQFLTLTPKAALLYRPREDVSLFVRAARGARAPQTSDAYSIQINQQAGEIEPETLDSIEAGFKMTAGGLRWDGAVYAMQKNNFFFRNANGFNVVDGKTNHIGAELSFTGDLSERVSVFGSLSLAEHKYAFTNITTSASSSIVDGTEVDSAPKTLATLRMTARPFTDFEMDLEWRHVGDYATDPGNTARYSGHDIFVMRGRYDIGEVKLFGRIDNVFDDNYANRADFAFGNERYFPGRPRTVYLGISGRF